MTAFLYQRSSIDIAWRLLRPALGRASGAICKRRPRSYDALPQQDPLFTGTCIGAAREEHSMTTWVKTAAFALLAVFTAALITMTTAGPAVSAPGPAPVLVVNGPGQPVPV